MYGYNLGCLLPLLNHKNLIPFGGGLIGWIDEFSQGMSHPRPEGLIFHDISEKHFFWHPQLKRVVAKLTGHELNFLAAECTKDNHVRIFGVIDDTEVGGTSTVLENIVLKEISLDIILEAMEILKNHRHRCSVKRCCFNLDLRHAVLIQDKNNGNFKIYCGPHADELIRNTPIGHDSKTEEIILDGRLIPPRAAVTIMNALVK